MATISSLGTGSGLDLQTLLTNLVDAEKTPQQNAITASQTKVQSTVSAMGALQSTVSILQSALGSLKDASFFNGRAATSSDNAIFTVTAGNTADAGSHTIGVVNLASANKIASGNFATPGATVGNGTLTIGVGSSSFNVTITAGVNDTVSGIRDAINNASNNTGVKASLLTVSDGLGGTATKLVLTANQTGAASQISIAVADGSDASNTDNSGLSQLYYSKSDAVNSHPTEVNAAKDALITVDGFNATSSTNTFSNAIAGVTITAVKGAGADAVIPTGQLTVAVDKSAATSAIQKLVSNYNTFMKGYKQLTSYDATTKTAGALLGNSSITVLGTSIRQAMGNPVAGAAADLNTLASIGITTQADGTLAINDSKLSNAINNRFSDVGKLFSGTQGVAGRLNSLLGGVLGTDGVFSSSQRNSNAQLKSLTAQQTLLDTRMAALEDMYRKQFSALDTIVAQLKKTGDFLTQQLNATSSTK